MTSQIWGAIVAWWEGKEETLENVNGFKKNLEKINYGVRKSNGRPVGEEGNPMLMASGGTSQNHHHHHHCYHHHNHPHHIIITAIIIRRRKPNSDGKWGHLTELLSM